jgi:hypothetical protein
VIRSAQEALGQQRSEEAVALAKRAADAIAALSAPTLQFEPKDKMVTAVELDGARIDKTPPARSVGLFAKQVQPGVSAFSTTITPGAHTVKLLFFGGYYKKSVSFTATAGKTYRIVSWIEVNPFNQLNVEVYEDSKLLVQVRNQSSD